MTDDCFHLSQHQHSACANKVSHETWRIIANLKTSVCKTNHNSNDKVTSCIRGKIYKDREAMIYCLCNEEHTYLLATTLIIIMCVIVWRHNWLHVCKWVLKFSLRDQDEIFKKNSDELNFQAIHCKKRNVFFLWVFMCSYRQMV